MHWGSLDVFDYAVIHVKTYAECFSKFLNDSCWRWRVIDRWLNPPNVSDIREGVTLWCTFLKTGSTPLKSFRFSYLSSLNKSEAWPNNCYFKTRPRVSKSSLYWLSSGRAEWNFRQSLRASLYFSWLAHPSVQRGLLLSQVTLGRNECELVAGPIINSNK